MGSTAPERPTPGRRGDGPGAAVPWGRAVGFGVVAGVLAGFAVVGLMAAPLFLWALATEPGSGLQRPLVRNGLRAAPIIGLVTFALTAVLSTRWRRGNPASPREPE